MSGSVHAVETSVAIDGVLANPRLRSVAHDCCLWSPPGASRRRSLSSRNLLNANGARESGHVNVSDIRGVLSSWRPLGHKFARDHHGCRGENDTAPRQVGPTGCSMDACAGAGQAVLHGGH